MKKKSDPPIEIPSAQNDAQPASRRMLYLVRDELKSDVQALSRKMDSGFSQTESRFSQMESRFSEMGARFSQMESRFSEMESRFSGFDSKFASIDSRFSDIDSKFARIDVRFDEMKADHFRTQVLLEEQNSNNRIVLEGLQALWQRQERIEQRG